VIMMVVTSRGEGADSESHWGSNFKGSKVRVVDARVNGELVDG
jgi:hypothetical protein